MTTYTARRTRILETDIYVYDVWHPQATSLTMTFSDEDKTWLKKVTDSNVVTQVIRMAFPEVGTLVADSLGELSMALDKDTLRKVNETKKVSL